MNWSWVIQDGAFTARVNPLPPGLKDLVFVGRRLRANEDAPSSETAVRLEQVHGTQVSWASEPGILPACDAVRSVSPHLPLTVRTADCLSVVLASPEEGVAVVHAGWRGLAGGIVEAAAATFKKPNRLFAVLGPAIGPCCFEVGSEVADQFPESMHFPNPEGKPHVDLPGEAKRRLVASKIPEAAVFTGAPCTQCHQHVLYSHRGSRGDGRRIVTLAQYLPG